MFVILVLIICCPHGGSGVPPISLGAGRLQGSCQGRGLLLASQPQAASPRYFSLPVPMGAGPSTLVGQLNCPQLEALPQSGLSTAAVPAVRAAGRSVRPHCSCICSGGRGGEAVTY